MNTPRETRAYDLVLFGASGFTGKLVAEYLATARPKDLKWALAGRSKARLEAVRSDLTKIDPALVDLPILLGDSDDKSSLLAIANQTRVICTTVGPYMKYGRLLLAACAESGTDYCDLTGETTFVREAIDRHHATAVASGARIVPCCGFDSIPSDLGVFAIYKHFAASGLGIAEAKLFVDSVKGGVSGGSIASVLDMLEEAGRPEVRSVLLDPYALNPDPKTDRGPDRGDQMSVRWDEDGKRWTAPFVMAAINTRVVRRSNALLDFAYGREFRYSETTAFEQGPLGFLKATGLTSALGAFFALGALPPTRKLLGKLMPSPGEGPSKATRESGSFRLTILATSTGTKRAIAHIEGKRDPGYGETARILGEAALCLAKDDLPRRGGVLTPASCMGEKLIARLRRADMTLTVADA